MPFRRAVVAGTFLLLAALVLCVAAARADEPYSVSGRDVFLVGNGEVHNETVYRGVQRLSIVRSGAGITYVARVDYDKDGDGGKQRATASYSATLLPSGEMRDEAAHDPDYL